MKQVTLKEISQDHSLMQELLHNYTDYQGKHNMRCLSAIHEDKNPSMGYDYRANQLHCFGCGLRMSPLDVYAYHLGIIDDWGNGGYPKYDFKEALTKFENEYDLTVSKNSSASTAPKKKSSDNTYIPQFHSKVSKEQRAEIGKFIEEAQTKLDNPACIKYLNSRGITKETAEKYGLGFIPEESRILIPDTKVTKLTDESEYEPLINRGYSLRSIKSDSLKPKVRHHDALFCNVFDLVRTIMYKQPLWVVEGAFDAMTVDQCSEKYVIALNSVNNISTFLYFLSKYTNDKGYQPKIIIMFDNDKAGEKGAKRLERRLYQMNYQNVVRLTPKYADHKDINDLLIDQGKDAVEKLLQTYSETAKNTASGYEAYQKELAKHNNIKMPEDALIIAKHALTPKQKQLVKEYQQKIKTEKPLAYTHKTLYKLASYFMYNRDHSFFNNPIKYDEINDPESVNDLIVLSWSLAEIAKDYLKPNKDWNEKHGKSQYPNIVAWSGKALSKMVKKA